MCLPVSSELGRMTLREKGSCLEDCRCQGEAQWVTRSGRVMWHSWLRAQATFLFCIPGASSSFLGAWCLLALRVSGGHMFLMAGAERSRLPTCSHEYNQGEWVIGRECTDQCATSVYRVALVSSTSVELWLEIRFLIKQVISVAI